MPFPKKEYIKFKMMIENENYNDNNNEMNNNYNNGSNLFGYNYNNNADIYVDSYLYKQQAPTSNIGLFGNSTQTLFSSNPQNYIPSNSIFSNSNNNQGSSLFSTNNIFGKKQSSSLFSNITSTNNEKIGIFGIFA